MFNLQKKDFDLLYFLLNKENLLNDIPLKLKNETLIYDKKSPKNFIMIILI